MNPAKAEQIAPTTKERATMPCEPCSLLPLKNKRMATATTKIARILYSAFRKDIAPSAILLAIRAILSLPTSCLVTHAFFQATKRRATTPKRGKNFTINSIIII